MSNELDKYANNVRRIAYICQDAQLKQKRTEDTMQILANDFSRNSDSLNNAKNDLERARAEEELANQAVDELIATTVKSSNLYPTNNPLIINLRNGIESGNLPPQSIPNPSRVVTTQETITSINQSAQPSSIISNPSSLQTGSTSGSYTVTSSAGPIVVNQGGTGNANTSGNQVLYTNANVVTSPTSSSGNTSGNKLVSNTGSVTQIISGGIIQNTSGNKIIPGSTSQNTSGNQIIAGANQNTGGNQVIPGGIIQNTNGNQVITGTNQNTGGNQIISGGTSQTSGN
ncbi:hypothetical protein E6Q11_00800 [Candidatus Dojkabacteria bacterium]|uniref:Uncharacterized protein n=1 Tax=Candidatus Dojkabacteria bacterium TaxID=2099670 RepID=A0A5C7JAX2_9BACT|nr:MAG: hypothetical protein E6Q11_00800 [Candidatus Dojkabacteria bacterium]